jgi:hypothetical protein
LHSTATRKSLCPSACSTHTSGSTIRPGVDIDITTLIKHFAMSSSSSPPPCSNKAAGEPPAAASKYCLCAPTTHPGSFRCRLHRSPVEAKAASAAASSSPGADQEATEAAAAVARELLERMARKPRRQGVASAGTFRPGPSRLGATATTTALDD